MIRVQRQIDVGHGRGRLELSCAFRLDALGEPEAHRALDFLADEIDRLATAS